MQNGATVPVKWLNKALIELDGELEYLAQDNPNIARVLYLIVLKENVRSIGGTAKYRESYPISISNDEEPFIEIFAVLIEHLYYHFVLLYRTRI